MSAIAGIHVLHVVPTLTVGGMELAMSRVTRALANNGMRHSICCLKGEAAIRSRFDASVRIHCLRGEPNDPMLPLRLRRLIRRLRPTIIHARNWGAWPDVALARLTTRPRVPLVFSFHGMDRPGPMPPRRRLACRALAGITTHLFTVSEASKRMLVEDVGLPARRIDVIPNGVDTGRFSPSPPRPERRPLVVGTVGSLTLVKNQGVLIRACARLVAAAIDVIVRLAGRGPEKKELSDLARSLRIHDRVRFAGHVEDVPAFLRDLDVFVLPSAAEAHPNALLEAMSCGLPCVASAVGGVPEMLEGGRCGVLVAPNDPAGLADALAQLARCPQRRFELARAARHRVCRQYGMDRMIGRYADLYRMVSRAEGRAAAAIRAPKAGEA